MSSILKTNFLSDRTQNLYHRPGILLAVAAEGFATLFLGIHVACLSGAFIITEISYIRLHAIAYSMLLHLVIREAWNKDWKSPLDGITSTEVGMVVVYGSCRFLPEFRFVQFLVSPEQMNQVRRLVSNCKQVFAVFGENCCKFIETTDFKTGILRQHDAMERAVLVEFEVVHDGFYECLALVGVTFFIEEDDIVGVLVAYSWSTLDMERELEHRLLIGRLAFEARQRTRERLEIKMIDGTLP